MRRTILTAALLLMTAPSNVWAEPPAPPAILELRINPLMDLHYWVRKQAVEKGELPAMEGLPAAVATVLRVGDVLEGSWGLLDASFTEATTAEELARVAAQVPESITLRNGRTLPFRQSLADLAAAYKPVEKSFLATVWPRHREVVERASMALHKELLPKATEVYADLSRHLSVSIPKSPIPVYLVAAGPFPGAYTMRSQGLPFSVVALEGEADSQWVEIVVHESIHGLDVLTGEGSVLAELRRKLGQVPGSNPREVHDFVHTLMFVQPASTVRRVLNPAHKDYGDVDGYYAKVPLAAAVVVPAWRDYLDGKITREAAVEKIVKGFTEGMAKEKGGPAVEPSAPSKPPREGS